MGVTKSAGGGGLLAWVKQNAFSPNPEKRAVEQFLLAFTPVWMAVVGVVMISGLGSTWSDPGLLLLGFGLHALVFTGLAAPRMGSTGFKIHAWVAAFAFGGNYYFTRFFYEILGMSYGFQVRWYWNNVPVFLYPLTVVYFASYYVLLVITLRLSFAAVRHTVRSPVAAVMARAAMYVVAALAVAFLETLLNANPFIRDVFCYEDLRFMLWFGTLQYGSYFVVAGWPWLQLAEQPRRRSSWTFVALSFALAFLAMLLANELLGYYVAPYFVQIRPGRVGLHRVGESCLVPR